MPIVKIGTNKKYSAIVNRKGVTVQNGLPSIYELNCFTYYTHPILHFWIIISSVHGNIVLVAEHSQILIFSKMLPLHILHKTRLSFTYPVLKIFELNSKGLLIICGENIVD